MKKAVIYGVGFTADRVYSYLKDKYEIEYAVDGNEQFWGKTWNGLAIKSPNALENYIGEILVTTTDKYYIEIVDYLLEVGIRKSQISRVQAPVCDQQLEIIPLMYIEHLMNREIDITSDDKSNSIILFCAFFSIYTVKLVRNMKKIYPELSIGVLSNSEQYSDALLGIIDYNYVYHSYKELETILNNMPVFRVFQFLWIENIWVSFSNIIRKKCQKLNLCIGGSDFYRARDAEIEYKRRLISMADVVSGETDDIIKDFLFKYPEVKDKIRLVNFGIDVFQEIDVVTKERVDEFCVKYNIPQDKVIITCGHNGNTSHQHLRIIEALSRLDTRITERTCFVFPVTYPPDNDSYIKKIEEALNQSKLNYRLLTDFMNEKEMAVYSTLSDILIHVQTTDQLSSTMLEEMYAGSIVIAGNWLKYNMLKNLEVVFYEINDISELGEKIVYIFDRMNDIKKAVKHNKTIVYDLSAWEKVSHKWRNIWE